MIRSAAAPARPGAAPLAEYRRKRNFRSTSEPAAKAGFALVPRPRRLRFCVQEHHASHLHYDFRLEMDGVLKSWAVPKGPTLDPEVRRLAMATEDHPLEYLTFEGHIAEGNYGAGDVIVWDLGEYEPLGGAPPLQQWEKGHLKFRLAGKKLNGEFALVHMGTRPARGRGERTQSPNAWLLIKKHDDDARFGDLADQHPGSVLARPARRSAAAGPRLLASDPPARKSAPVRAAKKPSRSATPAAARRKTAAAKEVAAPAMPRRRAPRGEAVADGRQGATRVSSVVPPGSQMPPGARAQVMLATLSDRPFNDPAWLFEIKWDGIRALAHCHAGRATLISRNGRDLTRQYPELARPPFAAAAVLDGEIVALDAEGRSRFNLLQQRMNLADQGDIARAAASIPAVYYAFDLLSLGGRDLTQRPLLERKRELARLLHHGSGRPGAWRFSDHVAGDGVGLFELARKRGLEGIVGKRAESLYQHRRSRDWLKFKLQLRQEAAIAGYTDPQGSRTVFGALVLALYDPARRQFVCAGRVGTGFDEPTRRAILARLRPASRPALTGVPGRIHWVEPELAAEVRFAEWTPDGRMRAPVFLGLRADKSARECVRESPAAARAARSHA